MVIRRVSELPQLLAFECGSSDDDLTLLKDFLGTHSLSPLQLQAAIWGYCIVGLEDESKAGQIHRPSLEVRYSWQAPENFMCYAKPITLQFGRLWR